MALYVRLYKLTEKAATTPRQIPEQMAASVKLAEAMGGKPIISCMTLGEYDFISVGEWPSDEAAAAFALAVSAAGVVKVTTLRGFTVPEIAEIVKKIP